MSFCYQAFGQQIFSEIELPELSPKISSLRGDMADVAIQRKSLTPHPSPPSGEGNFDFYIPGIAHFSLPNTSDIFVHPEADAGDSDIRPFILGTALGVLLHRKGYLVLHGNVIAHGDSCTAFIGPSGSGKSTLAAKYMQQGYQILSDDLCVIKFGQNLQVMPGYPQIKLWQDSADLLSITTGNLTPVFARKTKFAVPIQNQFCAESKVLKQIVILGSETGMAGLIQNTYRLSFLESPKERVRHLEQCQWIHKTIPITSLSLQALRDDGNCLKLLDLN